MSNNKQHDQPVSMLDNERHQSSNAPSQKRGGVFISDSPQLVSGKAGIAETFLSIESSIKRFLGRFLYRPEDVDELAQETFLRAYHACDGRDIQSPKAYLFRVAKNMALKELTRKSAKMTDYLEDAIASGDEILKGDGSLEEELMTQQKIAAYCDAIASMPPQCRKVFLLRKVQAKSHREIAADLHISISMVEKHIANGVAKFDAYMATSNSEANLRGSNEGKVKKSKSARVRKELL